MKRNNIISFFKIGLLPMLVAVIGQSCVKSVSGRTDFDNLAPTVLISDGGLPNSAAFKASALLVDPTADADTVYFHLNYAATAPAPQDEVISIGIDQDALAAYNALGGTQYEIFPDSIYDFTTTSVTVPKGQQLFCRSSTNRVSDKNQFVGQLYAANQHKNCSGRFNNRHQLQDDLLSPDW